MIEYETFELRLTPLDDQRRYRVRASAPGGETTCDTTLDFDPFEVENVVLSLDRGQRGRRRRVETPEVERAKAFGGKLFRSVFVDEARELFRSSFREAEARGHGLRVQLQLSEAPHLATWPWEFLYDEAHLDFFGVSVWTPIVRYVDLAGARRPLHVTGPLRILGLISNPKDAEQLDVAGERERLEAALEDACAKGHVAIDWLSPVSLRALDRRLRTTAYHVLHYVGHGAFFAEHEDGVLLFENELGMSERVSGADLAQHLADHRSLRVCVLNACEGARTGVADPFSGVAASLVRRELPAVIAMQFAISDDAALVFAEEFYLALAAGLPVDGAVAEARKAIHAENLGLEWGTPVLFLRIDDGRLFDVDEPAPASAAAVLLEATSEQTDSGIDLVLVNHSPTPLGELILAAPDGRQAPIEEPLSAYERRSLPWPGGASAGWATVAVSGRTEDGARATAQAALPLTGLGVPDVPDPSKPPDGAATDRVVKPDDNPTPPEPAAAQPGRTTIRVGTAAFAGASIVAMLVGLLADSGHARSWFSPDEQKYSGLYYGAAPLGIVVAAAIAAVMLASGRIERKLAGAGALAALGTAGVLFFPFDTASSLDLAAPHLLLVAGAAGLVASAAWALSQGLREPGLVKSRRGDPLAGVLALLGAALLAAGCFVSFDRDCTECSPHARTLYVLGAPMLVPLSIAALAVVGAWLPLNRRAAVAASSGLVALGLVALLLAWRFIAFPAFVPGHDLGGGGFLLFAGGIFIVATGARRT
jgi:hypothetical protein